MARIERSEGEFIDLGRQYGVVPVILELPLKERTAPEIYRVLKKEGKHSFLMEGDGRDVHGGRYSVTGFSPLAIFEAREEDMAGASSFLDGLRAHAREAMAFLDPVLPPFSGGLFGFFGYEMTAFFDDLFHASPDKALPSSGLPLSVFFAPGEVAVLDRHEKKILLVVYVETAGKSEDALGREYRSAVKRLQELAANLDSLPAGDVPSAFAPKEFHPVISRETYMDRVTKAREAIRSGEAYQIVLSQRFEADAPEDPLALYEALKRENPSPYHFFFELPEVTLVGASPEILVRVQAGRVISRPLAGTRRRGADAAEDAALEAELKADGKECAEHVMLVDLARNDVARTCRPESVTVTEYMEVERFARVMHIVSQVEGVLRTGETPLDVLKTSFPAGTVSGAPKIRAMEIIAGLEGEARNSYAGSVCALDYSGDLDSCIAIRTFSISGGKLHLQAGAGIVFDSDPETEYRETLYKANALFRALGPAA